MLDEWINSGDPALISSAAGLVSGAPPGFIFKHVDFVENMLERALHGGLLAAIEESLEGWWAARCLGLGQARQDSQCHRMWR